MKQIQIARRSEDLQTDKSEYETDNLIKFHEKRYNCIFAWGFFLSALIFYFDYNKELYVLTLGITFFGVIQFIAGSKIKKKKYNWLTEINSDMFKMPKTMLQLAFVQFFTWFALFAMWIYTTAAVTKHIYGTY